MVKLKLIKILYLSNFSFEQTHIEGARNIARAARECGVEKLIHFSALNASPNPQTIYIKSGSRFLKTKVTHSQVFFKQENPLYLIQTKSMKVKWLLKKNFQMLLLYVQQLFMVKTTNFYLFIHTDKEDL
jgi:hypothetical protein